MCACPRPRNCVLLKSTREVKIDEDARVLEGVPAMGLRKRSTQLTQFFQRARTRGRQLIEEDERRGSSAAEQADQREERRLGGMSAEDREWEQASLQRDRERQARLREP